MIVLSFFLSFNAWFSLYHADPRRSTYSIISNSQVSKRLIHIVSVGLFIFSLALCLNQYDVARAIALYLSIVVASGILFIFFWQLYPRFIHWFSAASLVIGLAGVVSLFIPI